MASVERECGCKTHASALLALGLLVALWGCGQSSRSPRLLFRANAHHAAGAKLHWCSYVVLEEQSETPRYAVLVPREKGIEGTPERRTLVVDGKTLTVPAGDGKVFVLDAAGKFHRTAIGVDEFWGFFGADPAAYNSAVWKKLEPVLKEHGWPPPE